MSALTTSRTKPTLEQALALVQAASSAPLAIEDLLEAAKVLAGAVQASGGAAAAENAERYLFLRPKLMIHTIKSHSVVEHGVRLPFTWAKRCEVGFHLGGPPLASSRCDGARPFSTDPVAVGDAILEAARGGAALHTSWVADE